jgi:chromosome segregation ATPase
MAEQIIILSAQLANATERISQLEAQVATLEQQLIEAEAVIKELRDRIQDSVAKEVHIDKPRSPMCG